MNNSCLIKAIKIYFLGAIVISVTIGFGYASYEFWKTFIDEPYVFTFCWALGFSVFSLAVVVPLILFVFGKSAWAKGIFLGIALPAIGMSIMFALDGLAIDLYLNADTEFGIQLSFPLMVACFGVCATLTALTFALSFRLLKKRRLCRATLKRVCLPILCLAAGATVWAFLVDWLIVDLTGLEKIIHFIAITGATFGLALGGATCFAFKRVLLGFFSGLGVAIVFLDYLVYGCIKMFQIPVEYYGFIALGFVGLYFLLGLIYCLARFKKIRSFVREGTAKYWLVD